jgi:hypothetical protein
MGDGGLEWHGGDVAYKSGRRDVGVPGGTEPRAVRFVRHARHRVIRRLILNDVGVSHFVPNMCCGYGIAYVCIFLLIIIINNKIRITVILNLLSKG